MLSLLSNSQSQYYKKAEKMTDHIIDSLQITEIGI